MERVHLDEKSHVDWFTISDIAIFLKENIGFEDPVITVNECYVAEKKGKQNVANYAVIFDIYIPNGINYGEDGFSHYLFAEALTKIHHIFDVELRLINI